MEDSGLAYWGDKDFTEDQLIDYLLDNQWSTVSCDVETIGLKDRTLIGIGIGLSETEAVYFRVLPEPTQHLTLALQILLQASTVVFHNGIFDLTVIMKWCIESGTDWPVAGPWVAPTVPLVEGRYEVPPAVAAVADRVQDTSLMAQVQGLPQNSLQGCTHRYCCTELDAISDILPKRQSMLDLFWGDTARKCLRDCIGTLRLWYTMQGPDWSKGKELYWRHKDNWTLLDLTESNEHYVSLGMQDCYETDRQLILLLLRMTARGKALRQGRVEAWYQKLSHDRLAYADICNKEFFNPSSPQQVGLTLAVRGNFLPFTKSKKQLKTDDEVLSELTDPLAAVVLEYRRLTKLLGTYFRPYRGEIRGYTHFRQDLSTSRLSSSDRNEQNIPEFARDIFAPDNGVWTWMDFNQLETRILAAISQDPVMLAAYARGDDAHWVTQQALWPGTSRDDKGHRLLAKTLNHAMAYRAQDFTLSKHTKIPISTCRNYRLKWQETYPDVERWQLQVVEGGWEHGWVENMLGRRCRLPTLDTAVPDHIEKCAINYGIQSSAADIVKRAMLHPDVLRLDQALQVHDEILVDGPAEFPKALETVGPLLTPFEVKSGAFWS